MVVEMPAMYLQLDTEVALQQTVCVVIIHSSSSVFRNKRDPPALSFYAYC